jgi:DNA repair exonuclease SbcCD ATPase subunit
MRLLSLKLSGFRGFAEPQTFNFDGDAVIVVGANGQGKTSLFDGVLWALCGRIPRLGGDDSRIVSMYSEEGQARVEVRLKDSGSGEEFTVTRSFDGTEGRIALETPHGKYQGPSAEGHLIDRIWPDAALASDPREALASVLSRGVYLQQDLIRHFVEAATDQERFTAVSELVGAGRVTELQGSLERAKKAWSTAANQRDDEVNPLRDRLAVIEARLAESVDQASRGGEAITSESWAQWWNNLAAIGLTASQVDAGSRGAPSVIDDAMKQLEALRRSTDRRLESLRSLQAEIERLAKWSIPEAPPLRDKVAALRKEVEDQERSVAEEQSRLAEARRLQAGLKEKTEQLKTLATLALKHLDDRCPVCGQEYDREATRKRLEEIAKGVPSDSKMGSVPDRLTQLLAALEAKEKEVGHSEVDLRSAERAVTEKQAAEDSLRKRLSDSKIDAVDQEGREAAVGKAVGQAEEVIRRVGELQGLGESLALRLAQSSAAAAIDELRREANHLRNEIASRNKDVAERNRTGELAQRVIEALREAASGVVEERLREMGPLLQNIYARIDPHPTFRLVTFLSRVVRGRGRLATVVSDPIDEKESDVPTAVLSSSQINALAVSVFLALNMGIGKAPLSVTMLDDPLQSLDDVNLLGLVDLLRRVMGRRQLCVSTHDTRFGNLLARKLRPSGESGRTIVIELDGWRRQGPIVRTREVKSDPVPLRLVHSRAG